MTCPHAHDDAAYVLGALSPDNRAAFERHLPGCADCSHAIAELAGIPGLLARVPLDVVDPVAPAPPLPATLLPALIRRERRERRRRLALTAGLLASTAAAVAVLAVVLAVGHRGPDDRQDPVAVALQGPAMAMHTVGDDAVVASVSLTSLDWGTRVDLTCDERSESAPTATPAAGASYAMYVHSRDGREQKVATWRSLPGHVVRVSAAVATNRSDIVDVDVRNSVGTRVLDLGR